MNRSKTWIILLLLLLATGTLSLFQGSVETSFTDILDILNGEATTIGKIIGQIRVPRFLLALITGGILSLSGFLLQAMVRNPLADPYILGISSGAGFGYNLFVIGLFPFLANYSLAAPISSFLGGLLSVLLLLLIGWRGVSKNSSLLIIGGVAVSSIFMALTGLIIFSFAENNELRLILFWTFGNLSMASYTSVTIGLIVLIPAMFFAKKLSNSLDLYMMGEEQSSSLGLNIKNFRIFIMIGTALMVSSIIAYTGPIGFVGMMIPHFSRSIWGSRHADCLIPGTVLGMIYLSSCDLISRILLTSQEIPIGIITALLGVPFFLYLLFTQKRI